MDEQVNPVEQTLETLRNGDIALVPNDWKIHQLASVALRAAQGVNCRTTARKDPGDGAAQEASSAGDEDTGSVECHFAETMFRGRASTAETRSPRSFKYQFAAR